MTTKKISLTGTGKAPSIPGTTSLGGNGPGARRTTTLQASTAVLELFFGTGIVLHEVEVTGDLPDTVSSFVFIRPPGTDPSATPAQSGNPDWSVRRASPGEDPDIELSAADHIGELAGRWLPVPYQLSALHAVQVYLAPISGRPRSARVLLAVDTTAKEGSRGQRLDPTLDEGRPFRPLEKAEVASFLDHPDTRDFVERLTRAGIDKALFKLAALFDTLAPVLPRIQFGRIEQVPPVPVSLVLDFGNSRSSALLVESGDQGLSALPLSLRHFGNPFEVSEETFDSRVTLLPSPFDRAFSPLATQDGFSWPSIARLGREALDRALETPHRYPCSLSGPKRYLWDGRSTDSRWHFAKRIEDEYPIVSGRILKYLVDDAHGLGLREDGPSTPPDPRYAPRTMMLFAMVELLTQAYSQVNSPSYRQFQGKEGNPRYVKHLVLTYPSGMSEVERQVYDALVRNAVILTCHMLGIREDLRPNWNAQTRNFDSFLFADEALSAQMVFLYEEVRHRFGGSMEDFVALYGKPAPQGSTASSGELRIASIDIGGGTTDVMIASYADKMPGTGTSLEVQKLFQDGIGIAGDEVCKAIIEDVLWGQMLPQIPDASARLKLSDLFAEGDGGYGTAWRTLRAKLVPNFWLPLSRVYWSLAEGKTIEGHSEGKVYALSDFSRMFSFFHPSSAILDEADRFIGSVVRDFPGLRNFMFRLDAAQVDRAICRVLREPLRRYADIIAQFDADLVVLAGRASNLKVAHELLLAELPVSPPRLIAMGDYRVSEWYPSKWRDHGLIRDPKSTVAAGATLLHLASRNRLPGFVLDRIAEHESHSIFGLYQDEEPQVSHENELFAKGSESQPFFYSGGMKIGFRNVASEAMDGSPLFEVVPASPEVEAALLEQRVALTFGRVDDGSITVRSVRVQGESALPQGTRRLEPSDFILRLRTLSEERYWLDTGVFKVPRLEQTEGARRGAGAEEA